MPTDSTLFVQIEEDDWHRIDEIVRVVWLTRRRAAQVFLAGYTSYEQHVLCKEPYVDILRKALNGRLYDPDESKPEEGTADEATERKPYAD